MKQTTRRNQIVEMINAEGECPVAMLAERLQVSQMTIRRDLEALTSEGRITRTHGGATAAARVIFDFQFLERAEARRPAKEAIAKIAIGLINEGDSVLLDSGTTTLAIARYLRSGRAKTVITTSLPVASELQYTENVEIILLGGTMRRSTPDLAGPLTEANLEGLHADVAFLGVDAVAADGAVYSSSLALARLLAKMAAAARRVYIVADGSKLGRVALARYGSLTAWDGLITDGGDGQKVIDDLRRIGVNVLCAK